MEFLPKEQCQKFVLYAFCFHDINYIIVLSYEFHIIFNCLIMHVSLVVAYSFMKESRSFYKLFLVQEDEEETVNTFKRD